MKTIVKKLEERQLSINHNFKIFVNDFDNIFHCMLGKKVHNVVCLRHVLWSQNIQLLKKKCLTFYLLFVHLLLKKWKNKDYVRELINTLVFARGCISNINLGELVEFSKKSVFKKKNLNLAQFLSKWQPYLSMDQFSCQGSCWSICEIYLRSKCHPWYVPYIAEC